MNEEALRARARETGLAVDWGDAMGRQQQVRTESLRRILESRGGTQDRAGVPPLVTAQVDARIALPNIAIEADTPAELALEEDDSRKDLKERRGVLKESLYDGSKKLKHTVPKGRRV